MISIEFDADDFIDALEQIPVRMNVRLRQGLDATVEEIAARARQTTTYQDRTSALRNSTQGAGVEESGSDLVGIVSFAARSKRGYLYGLAQEFGTHAGASENSAKRLKKQSRRGFKGPKQRGGIKTKRFIRDAIDAQDGAQLESAMGAAFRDVGFTVRGA